MNAIQNGLEYQIAEQERRLRYEHFGDATVVVYEGHPNYGLYDQAINQLLERAPKADNGSKFVEAYVTVVPKICVLFQNLQPLLAGKKEGSLLLTDIGKAIGVPPLKHPVIGTVTSSKCALVVKNIRLLPQAPIQPNNDLPAAYSDAKGIHINADTRSGYFDTNPHLVKTHIVADIQFGASVKSDCVLEVTSTGDVATTHFIIPLEPERIKIACDGSLLRKNGERFNISQVTNNKTLKWVNYEWSIHIPFKVNI